MKTNAYVLVFGIIGVIVVAAGASALVSNQGLMQANQSTVSNLSSLPNYGRAPNFQGISNWINSPPLNISDFRGKVVLVDFWTSSCINCIQMIPYLNALYNRFGNSGLVLVGVHTPEYQFEKNYASVLAAVEGFGIKYPVALDSNYSTWDAYGNRFWPTEYLIDKNGDIRDIHLGEGDYNSTEMLIQELLQNAGYSINTGMISSSTSEINQNASQPGTQVYVGYNTSTLPIGNAAGYSPDQVVDYTFAGPLQNGTVYFSGQWFNAANSMIAEGNDSKVFLLYDARSMNILAQGNASTTLVKLDGVTLAESYFRSYLSPQEAAAITDMYPCNCGHVGLVATIGFPYDGWRILEISASPGFTIYGFTFG